MSQTHLLIGWCFRVTLPCVLLFTVSIAAVHEQSAPVPDLSLLFRPPSCAAPCFLGMMPGQATLNIGLDQLRANSLIQSVSPVVSTPDAPTPSDLYDVEFAQSRALCRGNDSNS